MTQFQSPTYEVPRTTGRCIHTGRELEPGEVYYAALVETPPEVPKVEEQKTEEQETGEQDRLAAEPSRLAAERSGARPAEVQSSESKVQSPEAPLPGALPGVLPRGGLPGKPAIANGLGLMRLDVSRQAWEEGFRPPRLFSYWKSIVPEPNAKKKLFVDDAVLMNLLLRLEDAEQFERLAFRYVLALILMRKKLLRYDGSDVRLTPIDGETHEREWWRFTPKLDLSKGPMGKWNESETIEVLDPQLDETQIERVTEQLGEILEAEL